MANGLLYIACLFRDFGLTFCCGDGSGGILFGTLLIGFGFCLTGPASVANTERASDNGQERSYQTNNYFNAHSDLTPVLI